MWTPIEERLIIAAVLILGLARTSTMTARLIEMLEVLAPTRDWEVIRRLLDSDKHKKVFSTFDFQIDGCYPKISAEVVKKAEECDVAAEAFILLVTFTGGPDVLAEDIKDLSKALQLK